MKIKLNEMNTEETKGLTAKDWLLKSSPNEEFGLRAELQKHRLRGAVEKEMEAFAQAKLQEKPELTIPNYLIRRLKKETDPTVIKADLREWLQDHQPPQRVESIVKSTSTTGFEFNPSLKTINKE